MSLFPETLILLRKGHIIHIPNPEEKVIPFQVRPLLPSHGIFELQEDLVVYALTDEAGLVPTMPLFAFPYPLDASLAQHLYIGVSTLDFAFYARYPVRVVRGPCLHFHPSRVIRIRKEAG